LKANLHFYPVFSLLLLFAFSLASFILGCSHWNSANRTDELDRTLDYAIVKIPDSYYRMTNSSIGVLHGAYLKDVRDEIEMISHRKKIPMIIYMHGCSGILNEAFSDIIFITHNGYAAIAPNSFARNYKPISCNPQFHQAGLHRNVLSFRIAEAKYAYDYVKSLSWVDTNNIFLMGFSEGGITTAKYPYDGISGKIILGWTCNSGWHDHVGISGSKDIPVFAAVGSKDPWFRKPLLQGNCGYAIKKRPNSKSLVVKTIYPLHYIQYSKEVKNEILEFLKLNIK
jgi:hypothetical protein